MKTSIHNDPARSGRSPAAQSDDRAGQASNTKIVDQRPIAIAQRRLADALDASPRQAAQRWAGAADGGDAALAGEGLRPVGLNAPAGTAQRVEDEELLQGRFSIAQRVEEEELLQRRFAPAQLKQEAEPRANNTGLPDQLKAGIENLSGMSMDSVQVHYNSAQPAQLNALAYAQGTDIHVSPGQEKHLPHEAWHVVQQAQGRVKPTMQMKGGVPVNDDTGLEREADVMGVKAAAQLAVMPSGGTKKNPKYVSTLDTSRTLFDNFDDADKLDRELEASKLAALEPVQPAEPELKRPVVAPPLPVGVTRKTWDRLKGVGVALGQGHKEGLRIKGKAAKRKTTARVEERLERHMNAYLKGQPSKARPMGMSGQNVAWEIKRATKEKQASKGPRHALSHQSGHQVGAPADLFEDDTYGPMSESDSDSESEDDSFV